MNQEELANIIHRFYRKIARQAGQLTATPPGKQPDEETIHNFRVDIKKLRAFLRMLRAGREEDQDHSLKFPRPFKKMYAWAGDVRDRQLCLTRVRQQHHRSRKKLHHKIRSIEDELLKLSEKTDLVLSAQELADIENQMTRHLPPILANERIEEFVSAKLRDIRNSIDTGKLRDKDLHSIRKNLKDIVYVASTLTNNNHGSLQLASLSPGQLQAADKLSHRLGLFNDACIALSFIPPKAIKADENGEKSPLLYMRRKWLAEKKSLKNEILQALSFIQPMPKADKPPLPLPTIV
jgi:CHAD domain-containing protein